ncbi:MAG: MCP four helix bundle domain-containing protein, partial [Paraeggerthella sp.]|nr:MCP four helix bundle domain-containing protein [Paraeggerthella sp.]
MNLSFKNASISRSLMVSYLTIIVLFVVSICVAIFGVHQNSVMTTEFYERPYQVSKSAILLRNTIEQTSASLRQCILTDDPAERTQLVSDIEQLAIVREAEYNVVASNFKTDVDVLTQFALTSESLIVVRDQVIEAIRAGDIERAHEMYDQSYTPQKDIMVALANSIVDIAEKEALEYSQDTTYVEIATSVIIVLLGLCAIALVMVLWRRITRAIAVPVVEIEDIARHVAEGDLTVRAVADSSNELGSLAASMNKTV